MIIDATFWVAVSFIIFIGLLIYLKVVNPVPVNPDIDSKNELINEIS